MHTVIELSEFKDLRGGLAHKTEHFNSTNIFFLCVYDYKRFKNNENKNTISTRHNKFEILYVTF